MAAGGCGSIALINATRLYMYVRACLYDLHVCMQRKAGYLIRFLIKINNINIFIKIPGRYDTIQLCHQPRPTNACIPRMHACLRTYIIYIYILAGPGNMHIYVFYP